MDIRSATDADLAGILALHHSAFGSEQGPEIVALVSALLGDETARPSLSLVAASGGRVVGHVLFTAVSIPSSPRAVRAQILAPLAVAPEHQREGIGSALIDGGLTRLAASGVALVFVLGHPSYYPKFGFAPAGALGFDAPYPIPAEHADAWMVRELQPGILGSAQGRIRCAQTLNQARYWQE